MGFLINADIKDGGRVDELDSKDEGNFSGLVEKEIRAQEPGLTSEKEL